MPLAELDRRRHSFVDLPWTMLDEHHGAAVVRIDHPGAADGAPGDVAITDRADVPAAVRVACGRHGVELEMLAGCTGCAYDGFSHRVRRERQRHVVAAWRPSRDEPVEAA